MNKIILLLMFVISGCTIKLLSREDAKSNWSWILNDLEKKCLKKKGRILGTDKYEKRSYYRKCSYNSRRGGQGTAWDFDEPYYDEFIQFTEKRYKPLLKFMGASSSGMYEVNSYLLQDGMSEIRTGYYEDLNWDDGSNKWFGDKVFVTFIIYSKEPMATKQNLYGGPDNPLEEVAEYTKKRIEFIDRQLKEGLKKMNRKNSYIANNVKQRRAAERAAYGGMVKDLTEMKQEYSRPSEFSSSSSNSLSTNSSYNYENIYNSSSGIPLNKPINYQNKSSASPFKNNMKLISLRACKDNRVPNSGSYCTVGQAGTEKGACDYARQLSPATISHKICAQKDEKGQAEKISFWEPSKKCNCGVREGYAGVYCTLTYRYKCGARSKSKATGATIPK